MTEKHHPASSKAARVRVERGVRRETKLNLLPKNEKTKEQEKKFTEPKGFFRGARIKKDDGQ